MRGRHLARLAPLALVVVLLALTGLSGAACGGNKAAPKIDVLTPSTQAGGGNRDATATPVVNPTASVSPTHGVTPSASPSSRPKPPNDAAIKRNILARLAREPGLRGFEFRVSVSSGTVTIVGRVRTADQKHTAEQICLTEAGVVRVLSAVQVSAAAGY